jgi:hypothetical protein
MLQLSMVGGVSSDTKMSEAVRQLTNPQKNTATKDKNFHI